MNDIGEKNTNEKGFVLVVSLMLLLVTTLMGTMLLLNSTGQSKATRLSGEKQQTFLATDTGIEESKNYLQSLASSGNFPSNSNTTSTICDIPINSMGLDSYSAILSGSSLSYAYRSTSSDNTYQTLSNAMNLSGTDLTFYQNQDFIYYLSKLDVSGQSGSGAGSEVGGGTTYSGSGSSITLRYVTLACGRNSESNMRSVIMALMSIDS